MAFPFFVKKKSILCIIVCITITTTMDYNNLYRFIYPVCVITSMSRVPPPLCCLILTKVKWPFLRQLWFGTEGCPLTDWLLAKKAKKKSVALKVILQK